MRMQPKGPIKNAAVKKKRDRSADYGNDVADD